MICFTICQLFEISWFYELSTIWNLSAYLLFISYFYLIHTYIYSFKRQFWPPFSNNYIIINTQSSTVVQMTKIKGITGYRTVFNNHSYFDHRRICQYFDLFCKPRLVQARIMYEDISDMTEIKRKTSNHQIFIIKIKGNMTEMEYGNKTETKWH